MSCVIIGNITVKDELEDEEQEIFGYALRIYLDNQATSDGEVNPEIMVEFVARDDLKEMAETGQHNFVELKFVSPTQIITDSSPDYQSWLDK